MVLLIIGNGFDKWCGLNSGFDDYFKTNYKGETTLISSDFAFNQTTIDSRDIINHYRQNKNIDKTLFIEKYIILQRKINNSKKIYWSDVESHIFNLLNNSEYSLEVILEYINNINNQNKQRCYEIDSNDIKDLMAVMIVEEFNLYTWNLFNSKYIKNNIDIINCFNDNLRSLENKFRDYLLRKLQKNESSYNLKAEQLIKKIVENKTYKVMSFNYTKPTIFNNTKVEHVHGSLENDNIIIGIDNTKIEYDNRSYKFSKTYRKVEQFTNISVKQIEDILNYEYKEIIFYGHSLNEQDYAYFQTIFDKYQLYDSNIKLTFKYSIYNKDNEKAIKETQIKQVIKLIETYGKTLDNKQKGKNLLHKLLNEKRLTIKEVF